QPLKAGMAVYGKVQAAAAPRGQPLQVALDGLDARQHLIGDSENAQACGGQARRACAAIEQWRLEPDLQVTQLMRKGRLCDMQALGSLLQAASVTNGAEGFQMS